MKKKKKYNNFPENRNFGLPVFPGGGNYPQGYNPNTMVHYLNKDEQPLNDEFFGSMGYGFGPSKGEYLNPNNQGYNIYKPIPYGSPEWSSKDNPYNTAPVMNTKPRPKLAWPTRTDYSAGSVGPRYQQGFKYGGKKLPKYGDGDVVAPAAITSDPNYNNPYSNQFNYSQGQPTNSQYAQYGASTMAGLGAYAATNAANQDLPEDQRQGKSINAGIDATAGTLTPWYGIAKGLSGMGKSMIKSDTVTDPNTGAVITQANSKEGQAFSDTFTPMHETVVNDFAAGDVGRGVLNTFTGGVYNTLDNYFNDTNKSKFKSAQAAQDLANKPKEVFNKDYRQDAVWQKMNNYQPYAMGGQVDTTNLKNRMLDWESKMRVLPNNQQLLNQNIDPVKYQRYYENLYLGAKKELEKQRNIKSPVGKQIPFSTEYANGGLSYNNPNAEVEKEELMRFPNGDQMQVDGPSHDMGGVPVNIPTGTEIFSDRLKMPGTKKTFAKVAEKFKTDKQDKIINNPKADKTAKSTAQLIADIKQKKLTEIFNTQEQLKQDKVNAYAKKMGIQGQHMMPDGSMMDNSAMYNMGGKHCYAKGGYSQYGVPKGVYQDGGRYVNGQWVPDNEYSFMDQVNADNRTYTDEDLTNATTDLGRAAFTGRNLAMTAETARQASNYRVPGSDEPMETLPMRGTNNLTPSMNIIDTSSESPSNDIPESSPRQRRNYSQYIEPTVNTLLQNSGNIWDLASTRFGTKYDKENFGRINPQYITPKTLRADEQLRDADRAASASRRALKDMVGGNAGAYMANLTSNQVNNALTKAKIRESINNTNTGILNQADLTNTGIKNDAERYNLDLVNRGREAEQQNKARSEDIARQAVRGIGTNSSAAYKDYKAGKMDQNTATMISSMFKNYKLDMNNPTHWKWVFNTVNNKEE